MERKIDIDEKNGSYQFPLEIINLLLRDMTTGKNIIWATDDYKGNGEGFAFKDYILPCHVNLNTGVIKPRVSKTIDEQLLRTKIMAEAFTPSWVCNKQNNQIDNEWFGYKNAFNREDGMKWVTKQEKIIFPEGKDWKGYVKSTRLEITCGEAPYLVSIYDTTTGIEIPLGERIGLLDRKMRVVSENVTSEAEWLEWGENALKSIYGYEFQGDSLYLARLNILTSMDDYYFDLYKKHLDEEALKNFASIISWNLWQMDGMKYVIPASCHEEVISEGSLFDDMDATKTIQCIGCIQDDITKHNGIYCLIKDWNSNEIIKAVSLVGD